MVEKWSWYLGFLPWNHPEVTITYDISIWLKSINSFIQDHKIKITLPYKFHPLLRENDKYIMIVAYEHHMTKTELRYLNYCRLYMNVISIADLTDEEGSYIRSEMYENYKVPYIQTKQLCRQTKPYNSSWTPWKKLLKLITLPNRRKLKIPLGKWVVPSNQIRRRYQAYSDDKNVI